MDLQSPAYIRGANAAPGEPPTGRDHPVIYALCLSHASRMILSHLIPLLAISLAACGGGEDGSAGQVAFGPTPASETDTLDPTQPKENEFVLPEYTCMDEMEQAISYASSDWIMTLASGHAETAVPALWDGVPFRVDVSSTFPNADRLLDAVADEASLIYELLGYRIFVAGDILPLEDLSTSQLEMISRVSLVNLPPDQHIEVRCCVGSNSTIAGTAYPWWRIVLLEPNDFQSRHIVLHELYHVLGFSHPDEPEGVVMSDALMYGHGHDAYGSSIPTSSAPIDMARLNCIYKSDL